MADHSATLTLVLQPLEFEGTADYHGPRTTDTSNAFDGAECGGGAIVIKTPPVVQPFAAVPEVFDKAIAFPFPTLVKGRPTSASFVTPHMVSKPSHVDRVVVGHRDITLFRATDETDTPTAVPGFSTIEPFGYGASEPLVIPRTNSMFEKYGQGDLAFLYQGSPVEYQRVYNIGTVDEEVVVDYRGALLAPRTTDAEMAWDVGGEVVSRANAAYKPAVKTRKVYDLGSMMGFACETFGVRLFPPGGPDTGLTYPNEGGLPWGSWMSKLGVLSRTANTQARALMPTVWGGPRYGFNTKDTTTVHATIFADGDRVQLGLVDDVLEKITGVYGNGIEPDGTRFDGSRFPGFGQGPPAPYPMFDNSNFTIGTTDGTTDTLDGITIMRKKLVWAGYLPDSASSGSTFDQKVADAVDRLKFAANMTQDATMTPAAWKALWDVDVTGVSLEGARIFPLASDPEVNSWIYSASGDIIGRNPDHVAGKFRVDVEYDYGVVEEASAISHAQSVITTTSGHQWAGTITLSDISVFAGDVDVEATGSLTADDLMPARDLHAGMNVRVAHFDGTEGVVLHVAQTSWSPGENTDGDKMTLTVDTGARDIFDLSQALKRNAESRRNLWRERLVSVHGVKPSGHMIQRDKYFGKVYQDVRLSGGRWNQVPLILGQSGNVGRTNILLQNIATEHCAAVFALPVDPLRLQRLVGNPFQLDENGQTAWEHESNKFFFDRRVLLYLYGQGLQPGGYGWKKGYYSDEDHTRTPNPLTGQHLDDASWPYTTAPKTAPLAFLLIYPRHSCDLKRGQLLTAVNDDVT